MNHREQRKRQFLTDLFAGPFRGHAIIMNAEPVKAPYIGDYSIPGTPLLDWLPGVVQNYENAVRCSEALDDDNVPTLRLNTNTGIFASAFGCPLHVYEDSPAAARPVVHTAQEADHLPMPRLDTPLLRFFEFAEMVRQRVGPEAPISVPDIQSAFDIAALVWHKEDLFAALYDAPEAVKGLADKCQTLLKMFWDEFARRFPERNLCHCPNAWAPPELGVWLSEDEAGSLSVPMFEEFCLPYLVELSRTYGGLFVHCCATADHQYGSFKKIPNLRGLNRVFQAPGPRPAIEAFAGETVLMVAWTAEEEIYKLLEMALPNTRFLFDMGAKPLEEARGLYERLRARCPRVEAT